MKKILLSIGIVITVIACTKKTTIQEDSKPHHKYYGAWKSSSIAEANEKLLLFKKTNRLGKAEVDTIYAYDENNNYIYMYILPPEVGCDSLVNKELTDDWYYNPVPDCRGNCGIFIQEIQNTTNPDYMWVHNLTDSVPYCFPF